MVGGKNMLNDFELTSCCFHIASWLLFLSKMSWRELF